MKPFHSHSSKASAYTAGKISNIRLGRDNRTFSGTFVSQVQDLDGTLLFEARGTVTGERILALE